LLAAAAPALSDDALWPPTRLANGEKRLADLWTSPLGDPCAGPCTVPLEGSRQGNLVVCSSRALHAPLMAPLHHRYALWYSPSPIGIRNGCSAMRARGRVAVCSALQRASRGPQPDADPQGVMMSCTHAVADPVRGAWPWNEGREMCGQWRPRRDGGGSLLVRARLYPRAPV
jgi:hypothetical protein